MLASFATQVVVGEPSQFFIHDRHEFFQCFAVSLSPTVEKSSDLIGRITSHKYGPGRTVGEARRVPKEYRRWLDNVKPLKTHELDKVRRALPKKGPENYSGAAEEDRSRCGNSQCGDASQVLVWQA